MVSARRFHMFTINLDPETTFKLNDLQISSFFIFVCISSADRKQIKFDENVINHLNCMHQTWRARKTNSENLSRWKIYFYSNLVELSNFFHFCFHLQTRVMNSNRRLLLTQLRLMMTFHTAQTNHLTFSTTIHFPDESKQFIDCDCNLIGNEKSNFILKSSNELHIGI